VCFAAQHEKRLRSIASGKCNAPNIMKEAGFVAFSCHAVKRTLTTLKERDRCVSPVI